MNPMTSTQPYASNIMVTKFFDDVYNLSMMKITLHDGHWFNLVRGYLLFTGSMQWPMSGAFCPISPKLSSPRISNTTLVHGPSHYEPPWSLMLSSILMHGRT